MSRADEIDLIDGFDSWEGDIGEKIRDNSDADSVTSDHCLLEPHRTDSSF